MSTSLNISHANGWYKSAWVSVQLLMDIIKENICSLARLYEQMNLIIATPLAFLYAHENCKHSNSCMMSWRYSDWEYHKIIYLWCTKWVFTVTVEQFTLTLIKNLSSPRYLICTSKCRLCSYDVFLHSPAYTVAVSPAIHLEQHSVICLDLGEKYSH